MKAHKTILQCLCLFADPQIMTCSQEQWKYFLRSGHWRIPGEAGVDTWRHCNIGFVEGGEKKRSLSLQVAVQAQSEVAACGITDASTQLEFPKDLPSLVGWPKVGSVVIMLHNLAVRSCNPRETKCETVPRIDAGRPG